MSRRPPHPEEEALARGTTEHYQNPLLYDHEYRRRRADVNYYRRTTAAYGGDVLELGCGTGRVLVPLLRDGHRVVGVDRSQPMLRRCAARIARLSPGRRQRAELVRADFRDLAFSRRWPLIICPFNTMMHLYDREDLQRFFSSVRRHLAPGGRFCFDVLNPSLDWLTHDPKRRWSRTRFRHPSTGRLTYYTTNHVYDAATQIAWIRIYYDPADLPQGGDLPPGHIPRSQVVRIAHRQFFPEELLLLLELHGFTVEKREGGFTGEPFSQECESQVCTCSIAEGARR